MPPKNENDNPTIKIDEFLFNTIVELKITLAKLQSDSHDKTDLLQSLNDNLTAITYNIKEIKDTIKELRDKLERFEGKHENIFMQLELIESSLNVLDVKMDADGEQINEHVKEIKYAIQRIKEEAPKAEVQTKPKRDFASYFMGFVETIKNIRWILLIILFIFLIISILLGNGSETLIELLKTMTGLSK